MAAGTVGALKAAGFAARVLKAEPEELPALGAAAAYFFLLLCGYYVLRPVRDEMAIQSGVANLPSLMTVTFAVMLVLTPLFGALAARMPRRRLLPAVYWFFALNLLVFFFCFRSGWHPSWVARAFFVWLSVFNLFVVSVFWSFMTDLFSDRQAKRLFPVIAAGGSVGAVCGPLLTSALVAPLGIANLMPLSAAFVLACLACIRFLGRRQGDDVRRDGAQAVPAPGVGSAAAGARARPEPASAASGAAVRASTGPRGTAPGGTGPGGAGLGGTAWAGVRLALSSRYLLAVCGYIAVLTWTSVALFLQTAGELSHQMPSSVDRTRLFAHIDVVVNVFSFACQLFLTNRLLLHLGLAAGLLLLPLLSAAGFGWIVAAPSLAAFVVFIAARRVAEYAVARPAREALFTVLSRESKYKAKNFIDTAFTRGSEAASGWTVNAAHELGATTVGIALAAVPLALAWCGLGIYLAQRCRTLAGRAVERSL